MTQKEQTAFIKLCFETSYRQYERTDTLWAPEVPKEMRVGPSNEIGWFKWRLIPSTVTDSDLDKLECKMGCCFPSLLKTYLSTYRHCFHHCGPTLIDDEWPDMPNRLVSAGYLPFECSYDECYFIYCIDLVNMPEEDRCPVVAFGQDYRSLDMGSRQEMEADCLFMASNLETFLGEEYGVY